LLARQSQKRGAKLAWIKWKKRVTLIILCLGLIGVIYGVLSGSFARIAQNFYHKNTMNMGLLLQHVDIYGLERLEKKPILEVMFDQGIIPQNIPLNTIDLPQMKAKIELLGWVDSVAIRRDFPDRLQLYVQEEHPHALWQIGDVVRLIDQEGHIIESNNTADKAWLRKYSHLPIIGGDTTHDDLLALFGYIRQDPMLYQKIHAIKRIGKRRWDVVFVNNITVKLSQDNADQSWHKLIALANEQQILDKALTVIDLRLEDMAVMTPLVEAPVENLE